MRIFSSANACSDAAKPGFVWATPDAAAEGGGFEWLTPADTYYFQQESQAESETWPQHAAWACCIVSSGKP